MNKNWRKIAERAVRGLDVRQGEIVQVRDHCGRPNVLQEMLLAIEKAGATPLPEITPPDYLKQLLTDAKSDLLAQWDRHRLRWMEQIDRILVLQGVGLDPDEVPEEKLFNWSLAVQRLTTVEEDRRLPYLLVAVPTEERAQDLQMTKEALDDIVLPALGAPVEELRKEIDRVMATVQGTKTITVHSGDGQNLILRTGRRRWIADDGFIQTEERLQGAPISTLPAGALYTTVLEAESTGNIWLPEASGATDVMLRFEGGCVIEVNAADHADAFVDLLDRHSGDCGRVGYVGVGLNPYLQKPLGDWTELNQHVHGAVFVSLGENRYLGGENESSLSIEFAIPNATFLVDDHPIVEEGKLMV